MDEAKQLALAKLSQVTSCPQPPESACRTCGAGAPTAPSTRAACRNGGFFNALTAQGAMIFTPSSIFLRGTVGLHCGFSSFFGVWGGGGGEL